MQIIRQYRVLALFCAFTVFLCELIARPFATMGICDDGPYILIAQHLASTGHIVYNGWPAAMLGWQLYLGAAFIKLFGFSFTTVRMSTLLIAILSTIVLHRVLVRTGATERNATFGTLAFVVSPMFLMLSATFMSDIFGLFAVLLCLYGCLRAIQSGTSRATLGWLCFAVATNALCGTCRQIAWLGILVMLPSTLWILRRRDRVVLFGGGAFVTGVIFIICCMKWFARQPYIQPEHLVPNTFPLLHTIHELIYLLLDAPFLLVPFMILFVPQIHKAPRGIFAAICVMFFAYFFLASYPSHLRGDFLLEPTIAWQAGWVGVHGIPECISVMGKPPLFLNRTAQVLLTIACFGGITGWTVTMCTAHPNTSPPSPSITWRQLGLLLTPFAIANVLLLIPRATDVLFDRYLLILLCVGVICLLRWYQERVQAQIPLATLLIVAVTGFWGIAAVHNTFALYRARAALASELSANGVPHTSVDNGWEYDFNVELRHSNHINFPTITVPAHAYVPPPPLPADSCPMFWHNYTPHIRPIYGVSFDPNACYGLAPFQPVHYSRWPFRTPGTLYVVNYLPPSRR